MSLFILVSISIGNPSNHSSPSSAQIDCKWPAPKNPRSGALTIYRWYHTFSAEAAVCMKWILDIYYL